MGKAREEEIERKRKGREKHGTEASG